MSMPTPHRLLGWVYNEGQTSQYLIGFLHFHTPIRSPLPIPAGRRGVQLLCLSSLAMNDPILTHVYQAAFTYRHTRGKGQYCHWCSHILHQISLGHLEQRG